MIRRCDLLPQYELYKKEIKTAINNVLESGRYTLSENVNLFEKEFSSYIGCSYGVGVNSGTDALILAMSAIGIKDGDEIITTPFTAIPTYSAIRHIGAVPIFVDINPETFLIDINKVYDLITSKTKAIIPVHLFGNIVDIEKLREVIGPDIFIIEDCAHSFGATLNGKHAGTFGDAGVYSFYATKAIFAGEGGIVVTNNSEIADFVKGFTIYDRFDQVMEIGVNIRPSELQALFSYSVVQDYQNIIEEKSITANLYIKACNDLGISFIDQDNDNDKGNYYKFIITSDTPIKESLPSLQTTTSSVYDYYLGVESNIVTNHACLPIWYNQDSEVTERVLRELYEKKAS